jgi:hypothetical protein
MKMKITLSQALKEKKRLTGKIVELERKISSNNVYRTPNSELNIGNEKIEIKHLIEERLEKISKLVKLKQEIAKCNANCGIVDLVYEMEEQKSKINFLRSIPCDVKTRKEHDGEKYYFIQYEAQISREYIENEIEKSQEMIESLQDKIDELNAKNYIEI